MKNRRYTATNPLRHRKGYIASIFLFIFLFSANALLYSSHFVEEFGHGQSARSGHPDNNPAPGHPAVQATQHQHDEDQRNHHGDSESCCDNHSHFSILYQQAGFDHVPHLVPSQMSDLFTFIPEVYLDPFIPPAEPA